jgi:hypothetical protein
MKKIFSIIFRIFIECWKELLCIFTCTLAAFKLTNLISIPILTYSISAIVFFGVLFLVFTIRAIEEIRK